MEYFGTYKEQNNNGEWDGNSSIVYVPNNVTSDTPVYIFYPGDLESTTVNEVLSNYCNNPSFNGIVVIEDYRDGSAYCYEPSSEVRTVAFNREVIASLENYYGVSLDNRNVMGSSIGDRYAIKDFASQCKNGTDNGFLVIASASKPSYQTSWRTEGYGNLIKTYGEGNHFDPTRAFVSEEEYSYMEGKKVILFDNAYTIDEHTYVKALVEHGVDVYLVESASGDHNRMSIKPLEEGIFNALYGDEEAIKKIYEDPDFTVKRCVDPNTYQWEEVSLDEFKKTLQEGNNGNKLIVSNEDYLKSSISDIQTKVNSSNINDKINISLPNSSVTTSPQININTYNSFSSAMITLCSKFNNELKAILKAGDNYVKLDNDLAKQVFKKECISKMINTNISNVKIDLDKFIENPANYFNLWIANQKYSIKDFENTSVNEKFGFSSAEEALEAFIGVVIVECGSTKDINEALAVTSVALNRCTNQDWINEYNTSNPLEQMFANGGGQYAPITEIDEVTGLHKYETYMPSRVGRDAVDKKLREHGSTTYDELKETVMAALEGGLRNNDYLGFHASGDPYARRITSGGNHYHWASDSASYINEIISKSNEREVVTTSSGKTIQIEKGASLSDLASISIVSSNNKNNNYVPKNNNTPKSNQVPTNNYVFSSIQESNSNNYNESTYTQSIDNNSSINTINNIINNNTSSNQKTVSYSRPEISLDNNVTNISNNDPSVDSNLINNNDSIIPKDNNINTEKPNIINENISTNNNHKSSLGKGIITAAGITASIGAITGATIYGINQSKKNNEIVDDEEENQNKDDIND